MGSADRSRRRSQRRASGLIPDRETRSGSGPRHKGPLIRARHAEGAADPPCGISLLGEIGLIERDHRSIVGTGRPAADDNGPGLSRLDRHRPKHLGNRCCRILDEPGKDGLRSETVVRRDEYHALLRETPPFEKQHALVAVRPDEEHDDRGFRRSRLRAVDVEPLPRLCAVGNVQR